MAIVSFTSKEEGSSCPEPVAMTKLDRNFKGFAKYLIAVYGNSPKFIIEIAESAAKFARRLNIGNKRFKTALDVVQYGVPAVTLTSDLFSKIMFFDKITKEQPNVYGEREVKIRRLLGLKDSDSNRTIVGGTFEVGKDVCQWISRRPNTKSFIVEGFYKYDDLNVAKDLWEVERGDVFIVINFEERKFVWQLNYLQYEDKLTVNDSYIYFLSKISETPSPLLKKHFSTAKKYHPMVVEEECAGIEGVLSRLKNSVFQDFLEHFDVTRNVICLNKGLTSRSRVIFDERVNQYDIERFSAEIRKVLKRGRKRGYAFVGIPGTGKSTIIRKLEDTLRDYPIVYISPDNLSYTHEIVETFRTIKYMQPCIVIMEDLDSYKFEEKNERLGVFLDSIDDVNRNLNVVFIATINDTKLVHYTLINRPGRLDEVILVEPPKTAQEAYEVMVARFAKIASTDEAVDKNFPKMEDFDPAVFRDIIEHRMTQADVCELIEKAVLLKDVVNNESLREAINALLTSKEAIKICNFGGNSPYETDDNGTLELTPGTATEEVDFILNPNKRPGQRYHMDEDIIG
jgi:adenylate kinase family enzyme